METIEARVAKLEDVAAWASEFPANDFIALVAELQQVILWRAKQQWPIDEHLTWDDLAALAKAPKKVPMRMKDMPAPPPVRDLL
jgi:hypothetical protein